MECKLKYSYCLWCHFSQTMFSVRKQFLVLAIYKACDRSWCFFTQKISHNHKNSLYLIYNMFFAFLSLFSAEQPVLQQCLGILYGIIIQTPNSYFQALRFLGDKFIWILHLTSMFL
jgi:hypothetical protein